MEATREPPINTYVSLSPRNYQPAMLLSQHNKATPGRSASITGITATTLSTWPWQHQQHLVWGLAWREQLAATCGVVSKVVSKVFKSWKPQNASKCHWKCSNVPDSSSVHFSQGAKTLARSDSNALQVLTAAKKRRGFARCIQICLKFRMILYIVCYRYMYIIFI